MYYLEKLRNDKLYRNITILSLKKKKDLFRDDCIINLGNSDNDITNLLESNLLSKNHYKSIFTQRIVTNTINGKKVYTDLQKYYSNIKEKSNRNFIFKKNLSEYRGKNLIYDANNEINTYFQYERKKGIAKLDNFMINVDLLLNKISKSYKNTALYIPINTTGVNASYFSINSLGKDNIQYFYQILRNEDTFNRFKELVKDNNLTLIFHSITTDMVFKVDFSQEIKRAKSFTLLKTLIKINDGNLSKEEQELVSQATQDDGNSEIDTLEVKRLRKGEEVIDSVKKVLDLNGKKLTTQEINLLDKMTQTATDLITEENLVDNKSILNQLNDSEEFKKYLSELKDIQKVGNSNQKRIDELKKTQETLSYDNISIKDILNDYSESKIENQVISQPNNIFDNVRKCTLKDFDDSYVEKEMKKDLLKVLSSFSEDNDIKLFVTNIEEEQSSTDLTKKKTMNITFKDEKGVQHKVKLDMPLIKDGKYMYVNGSRKLIQKQILLKPIVKTAPDTVQVTTNYNKFFVMRFGRKLSENIEVYRKFLTDDKFKEYLKPSSTLKYKLGDCSIINSKYNTHIFYSYYSNFLMNLEVNKMKFIFNYSELEKLITEENNTSYDKAIASLMLDDNIYQLFGYSTDKKSAYFIHRREGTIHKNSSEGNELLSPNLNLFIGELIDAELNETGKSKVQSLTRPKTLTYNRISINNKEIPLIVILGYEKGLTDILERYDVKYIFTNTNKKPDIMKDNVSKIKFADGYLYYDTSKIRNTLLLAGLSVLATEQYSIKEFGPMGIPYIEYFNDAFGSRNTGKGIHNTLSLMVDPITLDVLEKLGQPTNIIDILLYANTLLEDNTYENLNDMNNYRIRGAEQVNAMTYKILADAFRTYKDTLKAGNPIKVSVPQDILLKKIVELPTVDEHSTLNPSLEIEKMASATYKGISGINLD